MPLISIHTQINISFISIKPDPNSQMESRISHLACNFVRSLYGKLCLGGIKIEHLIKINHTFYTKIRSVAEEYQQNEEEDEDHNSHKKS